MRVIVGKYYDKLISVSIEYAVVFTSLYGMLWSLSELAHITMLTISLIGAGGWFASDRGNIFNIKRR